MAALLGVSLFLIGCETEVEVPVPGKSDVIHVDEFVSDLSLLQGKLNNPANKTVALSGTPTNSLSGKLTVPANKALVLHAALPAHAAGVEISGTVYVEVGGSLTAASGTLVSVLAGGVLNVSEKGTLVVDAATSVNDGAGLTVLGPGGKVNIAGKLNWGGTLTAIADLDTALGYVGDGGELVVTTAAASITPTEVVTKANANSGKFIAVEANGADSASSLSVPVNARITTSALLGSAASITVFGGLTAASATGLAAGVAVTVKEGGSASLGGAIVLLDSSVEEYGTLTLGGTVTFASSSDEIAVVAGSTVNGVTFPAGTDITAVAANALTIGNLTVPSGEVFEVPNTKTVTVAATTALTVEAGATLELTGDLVATGDVVLTAASGTGGALLTGAGEITAGATSIIGGATNGWQAVGSASEITITEDTITGSNGAVTLKATVADATAIIAVTAASSGKTLTVTTANIDITVGGKVTLTGGGSAAATLLLKGANTNAAALVIDTSQGTQVTTVTSKLEIGGPSGSTTPAEIKINGVAISASPTTVVVQAASNDATSVTLVGKLGAGNTVTITDLSIVSAATATTTTIAKDDKILST
jgi:filamentous hemagglutinin